MKQHTNPNKRGSTLVLAMFLLVVFLGMSVSMMYDARSQASLTAAVKLGQFYQLVGHNVINRARANLSDSFVVPGLAEPKLPANYWFGGALAGSTAAGGYGNLLEEGDMTANAGMLDVRYRLYIMNNPGDPSIYLSGLTITGISEDGNDTITADWDMDAQAVLTVEVFTSETATNPVATISSMVGRLGSEVASPHSEQLTEGTVEGVGNQGLGGLGSAERLSIEELRP